MSRPWFPFYFSDYASKTDHLSLAEHGAYLLLMSAYYKTGRLPANAEQLQRICRAFADEEVAALHSVLQQYFVLEGDRYIHTRIEEELQKSNEISKKRANAAKIKHANAHANAEQVHTQPQPQPQEEKKDVTNVTSVRSKLADNCPHQEIIDIYHEVLPMCPRVRQWTAARQAALRQRWRESKERQSLDWWRKFFAYVAKSKFLTGQTEGRNGSPPFVAGIEWLTKQANMTKVIEGQYHRD